MIEKWIKLNHPYVEDIYEISSHGRLRTYIDDVEVILSKDFIHHSTNGYDYYVLIASAEARCITRKETIKLPIDELVALSFLESTDDSNADTIIVVEHKDGDLRNNALENLSWKESVEVWKPVNGLDIMNDMYEISSHGRFRHTDHRTYVSICCDKKGNPQVNVILNNGKRTLVYMRRLLADAFIQGKQEEYDCVRNIDGFNKHISVKNLEWFTPYKDDRVFDDEIWVDVVYGDVKEDMYEVSNYGRVRNKTNRRILRPIISHEYEYVKLMHTNNRSYKDSIHRLVCAMFHRNPQGLPQVNHIDGNRNNNHESNLEWVTAKQNIRHAIVTGLTPPVKRGDDCHLSKINSSVVEEICKLITEYKGDINAVLSNINNDVVTRKIIEGILYKQSWVEISDKYFIKDEYVGLNPHRGSALTEESVDAICRSLIKNFGNCAMVASEFHDIPGVSVKIVNNIKNKRSWKSVSDKFFTKESIGQLPEKRINIIKDSMIRHNGNIDDVLNELQMTIPHLTKSYLKLFKYSGKYFPKEFFNEDKSDD